MRRYQPRLTAANYRYFIRGQNSRAAATDYRVRKQRQVKLQPYDKMLKQFRWAGVHGRSSRLLAFVPAARGQGSCMDGLAVI